MSGQKPREIALRVLQRHNTSPLYLEQLLEEECARGDLSPVNRRLAQELAFGVVRWRAALDWLIQRKTSPRPQKPLLQALLRLGLYQLFWLDRIPAHAAVHETVELGKQFGAGQQAGFLNAVLRGYERERGTVRSLLEKLRKEQPATGWSHPEWLVNRWTARWGAEATAKLLAWNNTPPVTYARINTLRTTAEKLLPQWRDEGVEYDFFNRSWLPENTVFELKSHPSLSGLPSFQHGDFYCQDPSTLLAGEFLQPRPGDAVLDACAAPGGKTTYLAQRMQGQGRIVAEDNEAVRLALVTENCARLGVTCVTVATSDPATEAQPEFDRVLVDAPCSNTGVMRRRVELRWRVRAEEIERLRATQLAILRRSAARLKPGGTLVYSTCSLEPEENRAVVEAFLAESPAFRLEADRELIPFQDGVDGAYVARLVKQSLAS